MDILAMNRADVEQVANIHREAFVRQQDSELWLNCGLYAQPRMQLFVAKRGQHCLGYIIWNQKSGFRQNVVLELEQLAVSQAYRSQGVATTLIEQSLPQVEKVLNQRGAKIKHIMVTTRQDNQAQSLYQKTLGAKVESVLTDLYSANEVIMIARDVHIDV